MGVIAIFMSLSDLPEANISTVNTKFDDEVSDFAWHNPNANGGQGSIYPLAHSEAAGDITWYHMMVIGLAMDGNQTGFYHTIRDAVGDQIARIEIVTGGLMAISATGTTTDTSQSISFPLTKTRWDLKVDLTGSGLVVSLYAEGGVTPAIEASVATSNTGKPAQIQLQVTDALEIYTSELYVADFDTRNTRPVKQVPDATGNYSAWTGGFADLGDEDKRTGARADTGADKLTMNLEPYPGPASLAGIKEVVVKMTGAKGATGPANIRPMVRISATDYFEANLNPTAEIPLPLYGTFANNPDTSEAWGTAALDTTEFGVEAVT